jgi:hypothetical protein
MEPPALPSADASRWSLLPAATQEAMGWSLRAKQVATGEIGEVDIVEHAVLLAFSSSFRK